MIVVDASASLAWSFDNQRTPALIELSRRVASSGAFAPQLWPIEVAHVVVRAERRGEISQTNATSLLHDLQAMGIIIDNETSEKVWGATVALATRHRLSVYDATYLELAIRKELPLATLDDELIAAARAEGVPALP